MGCTGTRGTTMAFLALWIGMISSACGKDENRPPPPAKAEAARVPAAATAPAPVALKIQMSGLLLLVRDTAGRTHIAATPMTSHSNYIAYFQQDSTSDCRRYNRVHRICYVSMNGWFVDAVGSVSGTTGSVATLPPGVLDLSAGAGNVTVDVNAVRARSKSMITLVGGAATDTCSLAWWTFDPPGAPGPDSMALVNRLGWEIPDLGTDSLVIIRRNLPDTRRDTLIVRAAPLSDTIELLILNIPPADEVGLFRPPPATTSPTLSLPMPSASNMAGHVRAYYAHMGVNPSAHPVPTLPVRLRRLTCPITILGLENDTWVVKQKKAISGIRTQSCITASASAG